MSNVEIAIVGLIVVALIALIYIACVIRDLTRNLGE